MSLNNWFAISRYSLLKKPLLTCKSMRQRNSAVLLPVAHGADEASSGSVTARMGRCTEWSTPKISPRANPICNLHHDDLPDIVSSSAKLFADDTKLYSNVSHANQDGCDTIQEDLRSLQEWSDTWLLRFNASKCKCMHMGSDNPQRRGSYYLNGEEIQPIKEEKDLGVFTASDCKPSTQCTKAAAKAMSSLRVIKRTFNHIDADNFAFHYEAYEAHTWSTACPYLKKRHQNVRKGPTKSN